MGVLGGRGFNPGGVLLWSPVAEPLLVTSKSAGGGWIGDTLPKTNIDPDNGPMENDFPLPTSGFQGP